MPSCNLELLRPMLASPLQTTTALSSLLLLRRGITTHITSVDRTNTKSIYLPLRLHTRTRTDAFTTARVSALPSASPSPSPCHQINVSTSPPHGYTSSSPRSNTSYTPSRSPPHRPSLPLLRYHSSSQPQRRRASSSSSSKWTSRQTSDPYTRAAKLLDLKSRAAFKLLQINERHYLFKPGMTVVDLGYAPGSWSQVAIDLVKPGVGRVVGVDIIPVQPPRGVNGIQGDFLSADVQARVREFLREGRGTVRRGVGEGNEIVLQQEEEGKDPNEHADANVDVEGERCVDVVLSDMSAPWEMNIPSFKRSVSNPYRRMMNTTGNKFRDHAGSMDLCRSALYFSYSTLKVGGSFVCKFYQGAEDKKFEMQLKAMFHKVHREKPESSRSESRESFFVALRRLAKVDREKVFDEG